MKTCQSCKLNKSWLKSILDKVSCVEKSLLVRRARRVSDAIKVSWFPFIPLVPTANIA